MGGKANTRPLQVGPWPSGVNNVAKEGSMPTNELGQIVAVREAENIDFGSEGKAARREGYALASAATTLMHSGWSDDYFPFGLVVDGDAMIAVYPDMTKQTLATGIAAGLPMSYARINDAVFWANSVQCGMVTMDASILRWACPSPNGQPTVALGSDGALDAGTYQIVVTFLDARGRESGASLASPILVGVNGRIELTNIPQPPAGGSVRVYMTNGNDAVLRAAVTLSEGTTTYSIAQPASGRVCDTQFLEPMPPGQIVAAGNGRQYVARNKEVLFSPTLRYGLFDRRKSRVAFNGRIDMMAFVGDGTSGAGLFVADAKRTYFLAGATPADWKQVIAYPYGAVPGETAWLAASMFGINASDPVPVWVSTNGHFCAGLPGGKVQAFKLGEAVIDKADRAALLFREEAGDSKLVAALKGAQPQTMAVRDRMVVTEYRLNQS